MTNDELEAIRARESEIVIARRETHERDKAVMFQAAADRRALLAHVDHLTALLENAVSSITDLVNCGCPHSMRMEARDLLRRIEEVTHE